MKKLIYIVLCFTIIIGFSNCKKNKKVDTPQQDTLTQSFEEYFTNESDTIVQNTTPPPTDTTIMKEDKQGNLQPATTNDLQNNQKTFFVIVGSYSKKANAEKRKAYFDKQGISCQILSPAGIYNRVAIGQYTDEKTARNELKKYRSQFNDKSFWLLLR